MLEITEVRPQTCDMGSAENVVYGFDIGGTLSEFIDEMNDYLMNNGHYKSHLYLFNKNTNELWHQVDIEIPHGKPLNKSKLPKELLDLSVQCDYCYNCFASYSFEVYTYEDFSIKGVIKSE